MKTFINIFFKYMRRIELYLYKNKYITKIMRTYLNIDRWTRAWKTWRKRIDGYDLYCLNNGWYASRKVHLKFRCYLIVKLFVIEWNILYSLELPSFQREAWEGRCANISTWTMVPLKSNPCWVQSRLFHSSKICGGSTEGRCACEKPNPL